MYFCKERKRLSLDSWEMLQLGSKYLFTHRGAQDNELLSYFPITQTSKCSLQDLEKQSQIGSMYMPL